MASRVANHTICRRFTPASIRRTRILFNPRRCAGDLPGSKLFLTAELQFFSPQRVKKTVQLIARVFAANPQIFVRIFLRLLPDSVGRDA
jgi:hypothetical protein